MSTTALVVFGIIVLLVVYVAFSLFTMTLNDFMEKIVKKTLWLWLPFHALKRLSGEFSAKYLK